MKIIFTICFLFPVFSLFAQEADTTVYLTEMVISANKVPETREKISQQVEVITAKTITNLNAQSTADVVSNSGVATMQKSQQGGGSPQLRGFEASRVLLFVDGVRMNNLIYRGGHLQNILTIDNNTLERAEILLGPASTVYGSDALGGVIHFKAKDPLLSENGFLKFKGNAFARYGSVNNENTGHLDVNFGGKKLASWTSFTFSNFDDLKMGEKINPSYGKEFGLRHQYVERLTTSDTTQDVLIENTNPYVQKFSGYHQLDIVQKILFAPNQDVEHLLNLQLSTSSNIPRYDRLTDPEGSGLRTAEWYYGPQRRLMASYQVVAKNAGVWADELRTTLSYQNIEESRHDRRFNRPNRRNQFENVDVISLTFDLKKTSGRNQLRYGFDSQFNKLQSKAFNRNVVSGEETPVATRYPNGENAMNYYGLYLTHTFDINTKLTVVDGIRVGLSSLHSSFDDKTFFPFPFDEVKQRNTYASGSAGVIFRPPTWKFSLTGSTGYRVPNVDDLSRVFETSAGKALIVPNPDVNPEKTITLDASITKYFGQNVRWENTGYYTFFYDAILLDAFTFNGQSIIDYNGEPTAVMANQNKREAHVSGFSSVLEGSLSNLFSIAASINFTKGRIKTDSTDAPLDHIPPAFGRVKVGYENKKLMAEVFVNFNGWKRIDDYLLNSEDNEVYATEKGMPAWYTVNLRAGYSFNKRLMLQLGIDNVMDLQYRTFSSGINAPGRNFIVCLRSQL
jgi:hemoglobin/transferrin/lactoferrin receptor protein